jgi:oligosaccharide reducing-end xylanase
MKIINTLIGHKTIQYSIIIALLLSTLILAAGGNGGNKPLSGFGNVTVKKWADDSKSAFSFTFDDGFSCQYQNAIPILDSFGFKGTFFLITNVMTDDTPGVWKYGTWSQFRNASLEGHEIGSHTVTHSDLTTLKVGAINTPGTMRYELYESQAIIDQKITNQKCITIAYPYTSYNTTVIDNTQQFYASARANGNLPNDSTLNASEWFKIAGKEEQFNLPRNSITDDMDELIDMENYLTFSISSGDWGTLMAHEVYPFVQIPNILAGGAWYPMSTEWLTALCQFLKTKSASKDIWVTTFGNVTKYIKERDDFSSTILSQTSTEIKLTGTDKLNNSIYNYPLTVDISVPADWNKVIVTQGTFKDTLTSFTSGSTTLIRTKFVPDGGTLTLDKIILQNTFSVSGTVVYNNTSATKINNVKVILNGPNSFQQSTTTDINGSFIFTGLNSGTYTVTLNKVDGWSGVNSTDALLALRNFTNLVSFDSLQSKAGDVNNDNNVNSTDALLIIKRFTGLITSFTRPDWQFSPAVITVNSNQDTVLNIKAMITGDVNESFVY